MEVEHGNQFPQFEIIKWLQIVWTVSSKKKKKSRQFSVLCLHVFLKIQNIPCINNDHQELIEKPIGQDRNNRWTCMVYQKEMAS